MSKYRNRLPQLHEQLFITDGGLETTLIFHENLELPLFASFDLLKDSDGTAMLRRYFSGYAQMAREQGLGLILEAPTWRANADWASKLGYEASALADVNRKAIALLEAIRDEYETPDTRIVISGNLGPRGDGYRPDSRMSVQQARDYHATQIQTFAQTDADMVAAFTLNYTEEAIGIVMAAKDAAMPVAISFTLETDGRLPSGETLQQAILRSDEATQGYAVYYMINCAHPTHFDSVLRSGGEWLQRIRGLRANASRRSHAELDESTELDAGDAEELGIQYAALQSALPRLSVVGGCCGTDHRHVAAICRTMNEAVRTFV
ncbi:MAG TPA: homocysteine S-methyltransferase family protein [Pseudomonas sp.]|uniref:homocysteine S-methyltransferase family protein n=1 Tax=Pseudomonas sp. TaxID=306 RepID=UPI002C3126E1|nr:homocysteine S-methyltransferase family protein [Pseudomonas sp.]HSX87083.1 homocysteine S-methyltransferase family protein [Pseudomonas sp.]